MREEKELQRRERWERINESKYNRWYREVKEKEIPGYLKKGWGENRWRRAARFRLGCEVRGGRYWEGQEKVSYRLYGGEKETWDVWEECRQWSKGGGSWQEAVGWVLGEEEEGEEWMREIEEERKREEEREGEGVEEEKKCEREEEERWSE